MEVRVLSPALLGRGGVEAAGFHALDSRLTFMGARTTGISPAYAGFGSYAQGC